jgi:hypothetical protein
MAQHLTMLQTANTLGRQVSLGAGPTQVHCPSALQQPPFIVTNPPTVSCENPSMALLFEPYSAGHFITRQTRKSDKIVAWNAQFYTQQQQPQVIHPQYSQLPRSSVLDAASLVGMFWDYQWQQPQPVASLPLRHTAGMYRTDSDDSKVNSCVDLSHRSMCIAILTHVDSVGALLLRPPGHRSSKP